VRYALAAYTIDRAYGGPEEGGWWYDIGAKAKDIAYFTDEEAAFQACRRRNHLIQLLQKEKRDIGSVLYHGDRYQYEIWDMYAPKFYPATRPHYE